MTQRVRKAIFPVAGLGTRFLPATKSMPKEMLTVVDKPVIQYAVEEAREAGIEHFVMVTGRGKAAIEDHFDLAYELEATLRERNKKAALDELVAERPQAGAVSFTRQQEPLGLGHAVWCAREIVGDEAITAVTTPDTWGEAMTELLADVKQGKPADGIIGAVGIIGEVLAQHFPKSGEDTNEIPDKLIEL